MKEEKTIITTVNGIRMITVDEVIRILNTIPSKLFMGNGIRWICDQEIEKLKAVELYETKD